MASLSYSRVSHKQSLSGFSLETQLLAQEEFRVQADLPAWSLAAGSRGSGRFEDRAVSAWRVRLADRPDGKRLVGALEPGDDVIFYSLCRGFRSVGDWATTLKAWQEQDISMHFVKQRLNLRSPLGKFIGNILASIAQFKCDMQSERNRMIKLEKQHGIAATIREEKTYFLRTRSEPLAKIEAAFRKLKDARAPEIIRAGRVMTYTRCSHQEQLNNGNTLPHQKALTGRYAAKMVEQTPGLSLGGEFVDEAVSAWRLNLKNRPSGGLLVAALRPGDHLVVSRMDRAFRSVVDFVLQMQAWEKQGITVHFVDSGVCTSDPLGKMMVTVAAALAQYESEMLSAMICDGKKEARAAGLGHGGTLPRHLKWEARGNRRFLVVNEAWVEEAIQVREMVRAGKAAGKNDYQICDEVEEWVAAKNGSKPIPRSGAYRTRKEYPHGVIEGVGSLMKASRPWRRQQITDIERYVREVELEAAVFRGDCDESGVEQLAAIKLQKSEKRQANNAKREQRS